MHVWVFVWAVPMGRLASVLLCLDLALGKILDFAPGVTLHNTRWPQTAGWEQICAERRSMQADARQHTRLLRQLVAGAPISERALETFAARLQRDLAGRGVLCDAARPCSVVMAQPPGDNSAVAATVCLPLLDANVSRRAVLCEPYGEMWQQLGGEVDLFDGRRSRYKAGWKGDTTFTGNLSHAFERPACATFELRRLARWWAGVRAATPFVNASSLRRSAKSGKLSQGWPLVGKQSKGASFTPERAAADQQYARAFASWLGSSAPSPALARAYTPQHFRTCAVVGSGHDLRCGQPRGREIDAHDAVFRSNAAQHGEGMVGFQAAQAKALRKQRIDAERAGRRTTFRVSCIYNGHVELTSSCDGASCEASAAAAAGAAVGAVDAAMGVATGAASVAVEDGGGETVATTASRATSIGVDGRGEQCIVPHSWFEQRWGREMFSNTRHVCCDDTLLRSSYNLSTLQALEAEQDARFLFFLGQPSGDESIDSMLAGSGGNALHAAVSLCGSVDVYGSGLHSRGVGHDKIYAHAYDERVGQCLEPGPRPYRFGKAKGINGFVKWRKDRVRTEMLLHILHAVGVVRWVQ